MRGQWSIISTQRRPTNVIHHSDQGCQGEFNRSSQRFKTEVLYGEATGLDDDADRAAGDAVTGPTTGATRCGAVESVKSFEEACRALEAAIADHRFATGTTTCSIEPSNVLLSLSRFDG